MKNLVRFFLVLVAVAAVTPANAFSVRLSAGGQVIRWPTPNLSYAISYAGSDNLSPEDSLLGVRRAFARWEELSCSALTFEELGDVPDPMTSLLGSSTSNGINEVVWIEDSTWTLGAYVLGVTLPLHDGTTGALYEADIVFNGLQVKWKLDSGGGTDLESVAVHEIGHMFGMQHNLGPFDNAQPPTMAPSIAGQDKSRTLETDDVMGACFLYPEETYTCASNAECPKVVGRDLNDNEFYTGSFLCSPGQSELEAGSCDTLSLSITGSANLGEVCLFAEACADGFICVPWPDQGVDVCALPCTVGSDSDCPEAFACVPFAIQPSTGACMPAKGSPYPAGQGPLGCISPSSCSDGQQCIETPRPDDELKLCVSTCRADGSQVCDEGFECYFFSEGAEIGACFEPTHIAESGPEMEELGPEVTEFEGESAEIFEPASDDAETSASEPAEVVEGTGRTVVPNAGCGLSGGGNPTTNLLALVLVVALAWRRRRKEVAV